MAKDRKRFVSAAERWERCSVSPAQGNEFGSRTRDEALRKVGMMLLLLLFVLLLVLLLLVLLLLLLMLSLLGASRC